jgi:hypothetical protein
LPPDFGLAGYGSSTTTVAASHVEQFPCEVSHKKQRLGLMKNSPGGSSSETGKVWFRYLSAPSSARTTLDPRNKISLGLFLEKLSKVERKCL